jgi:hypothetical protein
MRTTLDIEDDVLAAARELAAREKSTAGRVLSRLARAGLRAPVTGGGKQAAQRNGIPVFPSRKGEMVTLDHVRKLMDEEGI